MNSLKENEYLKKILEGNEVGITREEVVSIVRSENGVYVSENNLVYIDGEECGGTGTFAVKVKDVRYTKVYFKFTLFQARLAYRIFILNGTAIATLNSSTQTGTIDSIKSYHYKDQEVECDIVLNLYYDQLQSDQPNPYYDNWRLDFRTKNCVCQPGAAYPTILGSSTTMYGIIN